MSNQLVALTLLLFGGGLALGNILGGKLADRGVRRAVLLSLGILMVTLALGHRAFHATWIAMVFVAVLGVAAFMTGAPMQMHVLQSADGRGTNLASSLNIAAFNLGNALGAWVGGAVIAGGLGLLNVTWAAAGLTAIGLGLAALSAPSTPMSASARARLQTH